MKFLWLEIRLKLDNLDVRKLSVENEALVLKCNFNFMVVSIVFSTRVKDH